MLNKPEEVSELSPRSRGCTLALRTNKLADWHCFSLPEPVLGMHDALFQSLLALLLSAEYAGLISPNVLRMACSSVIYSGLPGSSQVPECSLGRVTTTGAGSIGVGELPCFRRWVVLLRALRAAAGMWEVKFNLQGPPIALQQPDLFVLDGSYMPANMTIL